MITKAQLESLQGFSYPDVMLALHEADVEVVGYTDVDYIDVLTTDCAAVACLCDPLDNTFIVEPYDTRA